MINDGQTTFNAFQLDRYHNGLWQETLIRNTSNKTVVVIDEKGSRTLLHPECEFPRGEQGIEFTFGCITGSRANVSDFKSTQNTIPFIRNFVPIWKFESKGYYHEDINVLVSTSINDLSLTHPDSKESYTQKIQQLTDVLTDIDDCAQVRFGVNDPSSRRAHVYICIGGRVITVKCTNLVDVENKASLAFCIGAVKGKGLHYKIDIEDLFEYGGMLIQNTFPMGIGLSPTDASKAYDKYVNEYDSLINDKIESRVTEIRNGFNEKETKLKEQIVGLKQQRVIDETTNRNYQSEEKLRSDKLLREIESERNARSQWEELYKNLSKAQEANDKRYATYDKTMEGHAKKESARNTRYNESVKLYGNIAKVTIPILTLMFTVWLKSKE